MKFFKFSFVIATVLMVSCKPSGWSPSGSIVLGDITPIGIDIANGEMWISDGDHNRVVTTDMEGGTLRSYDNIERPMHLELNERGVLVPSYGSDDILIINGDEIDTLAVSEELEAPAAVSMTDGYIAVADFYNNRIVLYDGTTWKSIGKKGRGVLEFNYPTDVQIFQDKIYVADAYNNRIQVLDMEGKFLRLIGEDQAMNAATGIFVNDEYIVTTDFENDRVLVFNHEGDVLQIIDSGLNKPTDVLVNDGKLYIPNYKGRYISIYER